MKEYHEIWFEKQRYRQGYSREKLLRKCKKIEKKRNVDFDIDFCKLNAFICALAAIASSLTLISLVIQCYIVV